MNESLLMQFMHVLTVLYLYILISFIMLLPCLLLLLGVCVWVTALVAYFQSPLIYLQIYRGMRPFEPFFVCLYSPIREKRKQKGK